MIYKIHRHLARLPHHGITFVSTRHLQTLWTSQHLAVRHTSSMTPGDVNPSSIPKLKILMLHGYTQSGRIFEIKTKALKKALEKIFPAFPKPGYLKQYPGGIDLVYPTAPLKLSVKDIPGVEVAGDEDSIEAYGWWRRKGDGEPYTYEGMEMGLERIAQVLKNDGPFDGVLGFSQGGAAAGMVAALLEPGRREAFETKQKDGGMRYPDSFAQDSGFIEETIHPPLKFAVSYSGFGASSHPLYKAFYDPKIVTPMLHVLGSADTVVSEERSLRLVDACAEGRGDEGKVPRLIYHPGGHFLPSSQKQHVNALAAFIKEALGENDDSCLPLQEKVEDMNIPF